MTDDGGPAFPTYPIMAERDAVVYPTGGMTLRDWFAGQAVRGLVGAKDAADAARIAYDIADAMLEARNAGK